MNRNSKKQKKCPKCNHMMFGDPAVCPKCGAKLTRKAPLWVWVLILILLVLMLYSR